MSKYYRRREKFEALQFSAENIEEAKEFSRGRVYYDFKRKQYLILTGGHEMILREGDYLMRSRNDIDVWSQDVFETMYEEI